MFVQISAGHKKGTGATENVGHPSHEEQKKWEFDHTTAISRINSMSANHLYLSDFGGLKQFCFVWTVKCVKLLKSLMGASQLSPHHHLHPLYFKLKQDIASQI